MVEHRLVGSIHAKGDRKVGRQPSVQPNLPASGPGFRMLAAGDDDGGGELVVHGQKVRGGIL